MRTRMSTRTTLILLLVAAIFAMIPCCRAAMADPVAALPEPQETEATPAMVVTVDGQPVTDETQLLKLRIMIGQAGIEEPILLIESWTVETADATRRGVYAVTSIVTAKRFIERATNQDQRGTLWKRGATDEAVRRQDAVQIAVPDSWRVALERLAMETPVDTTGVRLGRVVVDGVVLMDSVELTKLRILVVKAGIEQEILLIETTVKACLEDTRYDPQVDGITTVATAAIMLQRIPSTDARNTRWKVGDVAGEQRARKTAAIDSWRNALGRFEKPKVFVQ